MRIVLVIIKVRIDIPIGVPDFNGRNVVDISMRLNKKKMLHKHRSFKALLIGYDENMKYKGNNSKVTTL